MSTIHEVRHDNLLMLIEQLGTVRAFADLVERPPSQISSLKVRTINKSTGRPRFLGDDLAREFEEKLGKPPGWFDKPQRERTVGNEGESLELSPRAASIASRLDALVGSCQQRAFALIDFTLRSFEAEQAELSARTKDRSRQA